ncbi:hypothetical protein BD779DRAFT_1049620 [Infundibulicybe gibba]|nr:hypothetical protein BD779DRAFT_1049620 [Infundibulicybe gibba]
MVFATSLLVLPVILPCPLCIRFALQISLGTSVVVFLPRGAVGVVPIVIYDQMAIQQYGPELIIFYMIPKGTGLTTLHNCIRIFMDPLNTCAIISRSLIAPKVSITPYQLSLHVLPLSTPAIRIFLVFTAQRVLICVTVNDSVGWE